MSYRLSTLAFVLTLAIGAVRASPAAAGDSVDWTLDPTHSEVAFIAKHLGFSKVRGIFKDFSAVAAGDPTSAHLTALTAVARAKSIDTGIEKRDEHLRNDDFFNADAYPTLSLVLKSITWTGNTFTAQADVTIRDVTKTVPLKGELLGVHRVSFGAGAQLRAGYTATTVINRKEFGLKFAGITEGISLVGDDVVIELSAELFRSCEGAAPRC